MDADNIGCLLAGFAVGFIMGVLSWFNPEKKKDSKKD